MSTTCRAPTGSTGTSSSEPGSVIFAPEGSSDACES
jgi:hypothetical protein